MPKTATSLTSGHAPKITHLEVDGACIVIDSLQQRRGEAEVHRKRRYIWLGAAQLA